MQAIIVPCPVLEQERSGLALSGLLAARQKVGMLFRVAYVDAHHGIPTRRNRRQLRVEGGPQLCQQFRQRIREVFVLPAPKSMLGHVDMAAKQFILWVERNQLLALICREEVCQDSASLRIKVARDLLPIERLYTLRFSQGIRWYPARLYFCVQIYCSLSRSVCLCATLRWSPDNVLSTAFSSCTQCMGRRCFSTLRFLRSKLTGAAGPWMPR